MMQKMLNDNSRRGIFPLIQKEKKMRRHNDGGGALLLLLVIIVVVFVSLSCWTDRSMDFWLTYAKGEPTNCPWYLSAAITLVAPAAFLGNVATEVCRLVL